MEDGGLTGHSASTRRSLSRLSIGGPFHAPAGDELDMTPSTEGFTAALVRKSSLCSPRSPGAADGRKSSVRQSRVGVESEGVFGALDPREL
jgi:hypothetical protein